MTQPLYRLQSIGIGIGDTGLHLQGIGSIAKGKEKYSNVAVVPPGPAEPEPRSDLRVGLLENTLEFLNM